LRENALATVALYERYLRESTEDIVDQAAINEEYFADARLITFNAQNKLLIEPLHGRDNDEIERCEQGWRMCTINGTHDFLRCGKPNAGSELTRR